MSGPPRRRGGPDFFSFLIVNFVLCMAKLFSFRHQGTKTLRKNNKIKSFVSLCLGGKYFLVPARPPHSAWQEGGLIRVWYEKKRWYHNP